MKIGLDSESRFFGAFVVSDRWVKGGCPQRSALSSAPLGVQDARSGFRPRSSGVRIRLDAMKTRPAGRNRTGCTERTEGRSLKQQTVGDCRRQGKEGGAMAANVTFSSGGNWSPEGPDSAGATKERQEVGEARLSFRRRRRGRKRLEGALQPPEENEKPFRNLHRRGRLCHIRSEGIAFNLNPPLVSSTIREHLRENPRRSPHESGHSAKEYS